VRRVTVDIPDWLYKALVFVLLLCRRLRYGYPFRKIPLTQGKYTIVDPEDYERLAMYKWHAVRAANTFYATRSKRCKNSKKIITIQMHRVIISAPAGLLVDHTSRNGLDNRKANLRPATYAQNRQNSRNNTDKSTSRYRGVSFNKTRVQYRAAICANGRKMHLGNFSNEIAAAKAYDIAAKKYHGAFAALNFP